MPLLHMSGYLGHQNDLRKFNALASCKAVVNDVAFDLRSFLYSFSMIKFTEKERDNASSIICNFHKRMIGDRYLRNGFLDNFFNDEGDSLKSSVTVADFKTKYEHEVDQVVSELQNKELRNTVYSIMMGACGMIVAIIAGLLVAPLFSKPCRNYVCSFFKPPRPLLISSEEFKATMMQSAEYLAKIASGQGVCYQPMSEHNNNIYFEDKSDPVPSMR